MRLEQDSIPTSAPSGKTGCCQEATFSAVQNNLSDSQKSYTVLSADFARNRENGKMWANSTGSLDSVRTHFCASLSMHLWLSVESNKLEGYWGVDGDEVDDARNLWDPVKYLAS